MTVATTSAPLRVLIASPLESEQVARIAAAEPDLIEVVYEPELLPLPRYVADHSGRRRPLSHRQDARWRELLQSADILFDFDWQAPGEMLGRAPRVRWIQATSAGIGEFVQKHQIPKDAVTLTTAAGVHAQPLAEFALAGVLYFAKDLPGLREWQQKRYWQRYCGRELIGAYALIIGMGSVGRRTAELFACLGLEVVGQRRSIHAAPPPGVQRVIGEDGIDGELPRTDYVVVAAPGTSETRHLMDARRLSLLPPGAVLINIGRGSIVDERAMIHALQTGRLRGAALDVFEEEPLSPDSPLWSMPNVLISPHSASTVARENERIVDVFIENLSRYLHGRPLINRYDYDRGY